jgi:mannosyl-glycoprotein endo-beta-N-acetylglucosaminidase
MLSESRWRRSALVLVASMLGAASFSIFAGTDLPGQPYASYWFPSTILDWDPATDPDAPFNRSSIPLAPRFSSPDFNVNPHAQLDQGRVQALVAFAPTSFNPSQGSATIDYYATNYWQYMDQLVFWGGSAGEGLILAPNPTVIDAAHRNGVPVLGNVYLPPTAFGGQIQWVHDFVQHDANGVFPVADKMIQAAQYYGFDGWFINQETAGGDAQLATDMQAMLEYFHAHSNLLITWYDSMISTGAISYQNALDAQNQMFFQDGSTLVSDNFFLNFSWNATRLTNSATLATSLGRSPYELYAGIDVESNGYNTSVNWAAVFPEGQPHVTSIGFYRPEWTYNASSSLSDFYARDNKFWVGQNGDPSNTTTTANWKGVANYIPANSPLTTVPFVTNFCTGQGHLYSRMGQILSNDDWNNLSIQDVLPTWRWIVRTTGTPLDVAIAFDDAYWGGSSLLVSGTLDADNDVLLYEASIDIANDTQLQITFKPPQAGPTHMQVGFAFADAPTTFEYVSAPDVPSPDWTTMAVGLGASDAGRTLAAISLRFTENGAAAPYQMRIGQIGVVATPVFPEPPQNVTVIEMHETAPDTATLRLTWQASPSPVAYYDVYHRHADDSVTWLGATPNTAYFVGHLLRDGSEATSRIEVVPIGRDFQFTDNGAGTTVTWDHIFADGFDGSTP